MGKTKILSQISSLLLLPIMATAIIPTILFFIAPDYTPTNLALILVGIITLLIGVYLLSTTIILLITKGKGTISPWDPTKKMVTTGPYSKIRNPMIIGVTLILLSETILLNSQTLLLWTVTFFILNHAYIKRIEETHLEKRFGKEFKKYAKKVPRWLPKIK